MHNREHAPRRGKGRPRVLRMVGPAALILAASGVVPGAVSRAQDLTAAGLGLTGGDGVLWVHRRDASPPPQTRDLLRFAYQYTDGTKSNRFWSGPIVMGQVSHSVATGKSLHVFFTDGAHHHYLPDPRIMQQEPPYTDLPDVDLPLQTAPIAACWDAKNEQLFVVITAAQAAELTRAQRELDAVSPDDDDLAEAGETDDEEDDGRDVPPVQPPIDTPFAIARYTPQRWVIDRPTPRELNAEARIDGILARGETVHVFYTATANVNDYRHRISASAEAAWSDATTLTLPPAATPVAYGWFDNHPYVIIAEEAPGGVTIGSVREVDGAWQTGPLLAKNAAEPVRFTTPTAVTSLGTSIAVAFPTKRGDVQIGTWSIAKGSAEATPAIVAPLSPTRFPRVNPTSRHLLQYAFFLALLTAIFVWRRDNMMVVVPLGPNQQYARTSCRMLALVLDLVILSPVWGLTLYQLLERSGDGVPIAEQVLQSPDQKPAMWFWLWAIIGTIFAVYAAIFERLIGATPGKRIVGCSVVGNGGGPGSLRSILIRNALRPIEFHMPPIALLVFLTPSRQRLGDIFAGTVVVETMPEDDANAASMGDEPSNGNDHDAPI